MKKFIFLCLSLGLSFLAHNASAFTTWDPKGTSETPAPTSPTAGGYTGSLSGTWESANWDTANQTGSTPVAWVENTAALFAVNANGNTPAFTVTMNANHTVAGIFDGPETPDPCTLTITGTGTIFLPGNQGFDVSSDTGDPGSLTINNVIADGSTAGEITWENNGALILNGANTYTGGFNIDGGGGVSFGNNAAFGTGTIIWSVQGFIQPALAGTAYNISNPMTHLANGIETFAGNSGGTTFSGPWALGSTGYVELENIASSITVSGVISGTAALTITNKGGTWTLTGVNTFTNSLTNAGTLTIGGAGQLNSGSYAGNILNRTNFIYNSSANQTLSGIISGAGTVTQRGSGNLTLSGVETYTGGTSNGATLIIGGAGTITAAGLITNNGTFKYSSSASQTISGAISGSGTVTVTSGTLALSGANTYTNITTVSGGTLNIGSDSSSGTAPLGTPPASYVSNQITLAGGTLGLTATAADITTNRGITLTANSAISATSGQTPSIESVITGPFTLTKSAAGNLNLNASNTFSGGLTVTGGGVRFNNNASAGTGTITVTPASIITLRNITPPSAATTTLTNPVVLNANGGSDIDLTVATGNTLALTGPISGVGYFTRGRASGGGGTVSLSGSNTFSGGLFLEGGILSLGSSNALGTGLLSIQPGGNNPVVLESSANLTAVNAITNPVNILVTSTTNLILSGSTGLELAGPVGLSNSVAAAVTISNNNTGASIISGPISSLISGIGLTLTGTNTLTLNGANTYNGNTTINGGTLALGASGSINSSPVLSIAAGATFDVSAISSYSISGSTSLSASGATLPATINGASAGTVSLGSQPITLAYDGVHPALTISQGTLALNGNAFTVNGAVLGIGTYTLISQSSGISSSSGSYTVNGTAIPAGKVVSIQVMGGNVNLVIQPETPAFSGLTSSQSITYGTPAITLAGKLSATTPATLYPSNGETVTVTINGNSQTTTINDTNGDFSINYNVSGLIYSTSPYTITYAYAGDAALLAATNTSTTLTVNPATAPGITNNPAPQTACSGSPASFTVGASGTNDSYAWYKHANAGWGSAWSASGGGGTFLASSTDNNNGGPNCNTFGIGDINTPGGNSWGIYGGGAGESVIRSFPAALTDGQVFQVDMDNGGVANGVQNGFALQNSTGGFLFSFYFQGGGSDYAYTDGNGNTTTSVGWTPNGLRIQVIVGTGSPAAYSLLITPCGGSTVEYSGVFATTNGPGQVVLFNNNPYGGSANDLYFNSMFAGAAYDDADNYSSGWNSVDAGDAAPIAGATNATYTTSSGSNGDQYYAIVSNGAGLAASATALLTVNPPPTVSVNSAMVCTGGDPTTLTATTSASSPAYLWSPGGSTNASISVSPVSTTIYTVTVTDGTTGCMNSGSGTVTVNPLPTVSVNSPTVCAGSPAMLTATTSASNPTYLWSDSETNASITVSPSSTTTYTVTVTDGTTGCTNGGSGTVTVNPLPTVSVNLATICAGGSAMLTATTSASSPAYLWSPGGSTNASISVSPSSTTVYTVTVTDGTTGCANGGSGTVTVNPLPTIALSTNSILVDYGTTNAGLPYTGTTGTPDGYSITYDTNALAAGFSNVTLTALPASPIPLAVPAIAAGTNVYNGTLTVYYSSTGCGSTNYAFTVTVVPLPVVLTGTRPFDGTNDASASILTVSNDLDGTNLTLSGSAVLAGSAVGPQSISDFTGLSLGGSAAGNYTLAGASGTVTITSAALTPVFTNLTASQSITYGTASITLSGTLSAPGPVYPTNGETITVSINGNAQTTTINDTNGDFSINYSSGTLPVDFPPFYTITYSYAGDSMLTAASDTNTTLEVNVRPVVLVGTKVYDGTADAPAIILSVANAVNGDMVTVVSGDATLVSANVGTNAILYMGTLQLGGAGGYTITGGVGTVVVTMAPLTITANNDSKVYGQVKTYGAGSTAFTSSPLQNGETIGTVTITASGGTAANAPIGTYNLTPGAATGGTFSPGNYAITYNPGTLTVSVLTAILTGTRPYDGTTIATNTILSVSNKVAGDDVNLASGSGTLSSVAVGTNLITSLGSLALGGTTASNYTLSSATGAVVITDPGLPFSILSITLVGTNLYMVFQSIPGDTYQCLSTEDLTLPRSSWTNEAPPITATGTITTNIIPDGRSKSYIFKNSK